MRETIISCKRGSTFRIAKIHATGPLKERLMSLGLMKSYNFV